MDRRWVRLARGERVDNEVERGEPQQRADPPKALRVEHARDLLAVPALPTEWLVQGVLPRVGVVILGGPPKNYKTFFALQLAVAVGDSSVQAFLGRDIRHGPVLFVEREGSRQSHVARLGRISWALEADEPDISLVLHQPLLLDEDASVARLDELMKTLRPSLVVLDPLIHFHRGEENSNSDMARAMRPLVDLAHAHSCVCLVVHHTTKPHPDGRGQKVGDRLRGASALAAATDGNLVMDRQGDRRARLRGDLRDGEQVDIYLEFDPDTFLLSAASGPFRKVKIDSTDLIEWVQHEGQVRVADAMKRFGVAKNTAREALDREVSQGALAADRSAAAHVFRVAEPQIRALPGQSAHPSMG